ncbi:MAG: hypothetical protein AAGA46_00420 [Cyanobacteria bacterium P01_F01_bin.13]
MSKSCGKRHTPNQGEPGRPKGATPPVSAAERMKAYRAKHKERINQEQRDRREAAKKKSEDNP